MENEVEANLIVAATKTITSINQSTTHTVSAAGLSTNGNVYTGVNVHHFTGGPCAEAVVLGAAAAANDSKLTHIVAVGDQGRGVLNPCGRCRQMLADLQPDIKVVVIGSEGARTETIRDLLPFAYVKVYK